MPTKLPELYRDFRGSASLEALATRLGTTKQNLSQIENGLSAPSRATIRRYVDHTDPAVREFGWRLFRALYPAVVDELLPLN